MLAREAAAICFPRKPRWKRPLLTMCCAGAACFIFDLQNHHVSPLATWKNPNNPWAKTLEVAGGVESKTRDHYIKEVFLDSDTDVAVLTYFPSTEDEMPLPTKEAAITQKLIDSMKGSHRLLIHGRVIPVFEGDVARMASLAARWNVAAWKTYTQFGAGFWLDGPEMAPMMEEARRLNKRIVCIHKGMPFSKIENRRAVLQRGRCWPGGPHVSRT